MDPNKSELKIMRTHEYQSWRMTEFMKTHSMPFAILLAGLISATAASNFLFITQDISNTFLMFAVITIIAAPIMVIMEHSRYVHKRRLIWNIREEVD